MLIRSCPLKILIHRYWKSFICSWNWKDICHGILFELLFFKSVVYKISEVFRKGGIVEHMITSCKGQIGLQRQQHEMDRIVLIQKIVMSFFQLMAE